MKRTLPIALLLAALAVPAGASARVSELGSNTDQVRPSCPEDCTALSKTTGYQGRSGRLRSPYIVPSKGKIVAFTVTLGNPAAEQISQFFAPRFGSQASIRLSVFRQGKTRRTRRTLRLLRQSKVYRLNRYFGSSPTFALDKPLPVTKGYVLGVTSPTWAPIFATKLPAGNWWRAARDKRRDDNCKGISRDSTVTKINSVTTFGCDYYGVRLLYTATFIPDPRPTRR